MTHEITMRVGFPICRLLHYDNKTLGRIFRHELMHKLHEEREEAIKNLKVITDLTADIANITHC